MSLQILIGFSQHKEQRRRAQTVIFLKQEKEGKGKLQFDKLKKRYKKTWGTAITSKSKARVTKNQIFYIELQHKHIKY